jgi:hypothetical protein
LHKVFQQQGQSSPLLQNNNPGHVYCLPPRKTWQTWKGPKGILHLCYSAWRTTKYYYSHDSDKDSIARKGTGR